ncbi:MAG: M56 family metallopeptidase [Planctomycetota bacterium]
MTFASWLISLGIEGFVLCGVGLIAYVALRTHAASWRHLSLTATVVSLLSLTVLAVIPPLVQLPVLTAFAAADVMVNAKVVDKAENHPRSIEDDSTYSGDQSYTTNESSFDTWTPTQDQPIASATGIPATQGPSSTSTGPIDAGGVRQDSPDARESNIVETATTLRVSLDEIALAVIVVWRIGAFAALMIPLVGLVGIHRTRGSSKRVVDSRWHNQLNNLREELGIQGKVSLRTSSVIQCAMTWGVLRPTILLPTAADQWSQDQRKIVLLHELGHIRRFDWATQMLGSLCCSLHWFNPMVWWISRQMRIEREQACDDLVLRTGVESTVYAEKLLELAKQFRPYPLAAIPMAQKSRLEQRMRAILDRNRRREPPSYHMILATVFACTVLMVPLALVGATDAPPSRPRGSNEAKASSTDDGADPTGAEDHKQSTEANSQVKESQESETSASTAELNVTVRDESDNPILGASVEALGWTGQFKSLGIAGQTDADGSVALTDLPVDDYLYIRVSAEGYVSKTPAITFTKTTTRDLTIKMYPPVEGWIDVRDENGEPVMGAELMVLQYTDHDDTAFVLTKEISETLGVQWEKSDSSGRLMLPPMPAGVSLSMIVIHPDWKPIRVTEIEPSPGLISSVTLYHGVPVEIVLSPADAAKPIADGTSVDVLMLADGGSFGGLTVRHQFEVRDQRIRFQANDSNFRELRVSTDDYFVGPILYNFPSSPMQKLNLTEAESTTIEVKAYPKQRVRGRVVDHRGNGVKGAYVHGTLVDLQKLKVIDEAGTNDEDNPFLKAGAMTVAGNATSDANGDYELELAPGTASVEAIRTGFYSEDTTGHFEVAADGDSTVPEIVLLPVPVIRGHVKDQEGKPVPGVIVKLHSLGRGDALPVGLSDEQGKFELTMTRIPYAADGDGLEAQAEVCAIAPNSDLAGSTEINLLEISSATEVNVALSSDLPKWLSEIREGSRKELSKELQEFQENLKTKYAAGLPGEPAPLMTSGTWLNTNATSLEAFRGRFVLIDFWFIGCGPCHRDMPQIKVAHEAFASDKFAVVSVHTNTMKPDVVKGFADENEMSYAIVVDDSRGQIAREYRPLGVDSYPSYLLIDPDGNVLLNDSVPCGGSLRSHKIELIHKAIQAWDWESPTEE